MLVTLNTYSDFQGIVNAIGEVTGVFYQDNTGSSSGFICVAFCDNGRTVVYAPLNQAHATSTATFTANFPTAVAFVGSLALT